MAKQPAQPSLFSGIRPAPPLPPHNGTPTSIAAAEAIRPKAGAQAIKVLEFIRSRGVMGATRHEIAEGLNIPLASVCGRVGGRGGLMACGLVVESGTRVGPYGQSAAVLISAAQQSPLSERN